MAKKVLISSYRAPYNKKTKRYAWFSRIIQKDLAKVLEDKSFPEWEWQPNEPFEARFRILQFTRGSSSCKLLMVKFEDYSKYQKDNHGRDFVMYEVFMEDAPDIIRNSIYGIIEGKFKFIKRGSNYGIMLVNNDNYEDISPAIETFLCEYCFKNSVFVFNDEHSSNKIPLEKFQEVSIEVQREFPEINIQHINHIIRKYIL